VWWWYKNLAEFTIEWELPHMSKEQHDQIFPLLKMQAEGGVKPQVFNDADMIVVGDPERCLEKMIKYQDLGVDQLICYVQFGYLSHESVMKTIELLGKELIPELNKRDIEVQTTVKAKKPGKPGDFEKAKGIID